MAMPHTIILESKHQEIIVEALLMSIIDKEQNVIKSDEKLELARKQYIDASQKIMKPVKCGMISNNLFTWIIDQINHSPNIKYMETAMYAKVICEMAATNKYDIFTEKSPVSYN
jgi:hypothetical protein